MKMNYKVQKYRKFKILLALNFKLVPRQPEAQG